MDYYLKQATLIKKIAQKSNPEIQPQNPVSSNALTFGNNNDTNYSEQAKERLSSFITDPDKLDQITTALYTDNDKYLKELVINWPDYEAKLQTLKGSVVSVKRVVDVLEDRLQEALGKKTIKPDKAVVAERKQEVEERNMMGNEDVLAKNVRDQIREQEHYTEEKIKEIKDKLYPSALENYKKLIKGACKYQAPTLAVWDSYLRGFKRQLFSLILVEYSTDSHLAILVARISVAYFGKPLDA